MHSIAGHKQFLYRAGIRQGLFELCIACWCGFGFASALLKCHALFALHARNHDYKTNRHAMWWHGTVGTERIWQWAVSSIYGIAWQMYSYKPSVQPQCSKHSGINLPPQHCTLSLRCFFPPQISMIGFLQVRIWATTQLYELSTIRAKKLLVSFRDIFCLVQCIVRELLRETLAFCKLFCLNTLIHGCFNNRWCPAVLGGIRSRHICLFGVYKYMCM